MASNHKVLLSKKRNNCTDTCFFGSMYFADKNKIKYHFGQNIDEICYLRSLAKPLQASIAFDYNIINDYKINDKELAIVHGSHSGTNCHIKVLKNLAKKTKVKIKDLLIEAQLPLDLKDFKGIKTKLHNNCSGKHLFMVIISKYLSFDINNYLDPNHPLQKLIYKKQVKLSGYKSDYLTYDGCGTPLWGLPYKNVIEAFYNLMNDKKYSLLINSAVKNPYIFGGNNRLDTEIIKLGKGNLYSKVGAGGLVLIYNLKTDEQLLIKLSQDNNPQRRLIALKALNELNWIKTDIEEFEYNQKNTQVAKYCYEFSLK